MINETLADAESRMAKSIEALHRDLNTIRTGRASPAILDRITVEYYGTPTPLNQMANISVPESRLLVIQPWDKGVIPDIERALQKSDIGITPSSDGVVIRLAIPALTEERRKQLVKQVHSQIEDAKVAIRNVRRDANDHLKKLLKDKLISEDNEKDGLDQVQKLTDQHIAKLNDVAAQKEKDVMTV